MAIKMRINKCPDKCICRSCGATKKDTLEFFDISFGERNTIEITICDKCNEVLFNKSLRATCAVNSKLKSPADLKIIRNRAVREQRSNE